MKTSCQQKTYRIERKCSNCGSKSELEVSKRDAAFELFDMNKSFGISCLKCSSNKFITYYNHPALDYELLKEWAQNSDLHLMEQDEELFLSEEKYLETILNILDFETILDHKRNVLMDVLCIIVYDNSQNEDLKINNNLKNRVITEINKRIEKLKLADDWILDYIKKVVYPQLNFQNKNVS